MISADVKGDVKQQELVALSNNFLVPSKLKWQRKTGGMYFYLILLVIPPTWHCPLGTGGWKVFHFTDKICQAWQKLFDSP